MIFDTHAHYDDKAFDEDRERLLREMNADGVDFIVNVGSDLASNQKTMELAHTYSFVYGAVGVHPSETENLTEKDINDLKKLAGDEKIVAIGEIGLDYHWQQPERKLQQQWFERQLLLAKEVQLPVIIHSREAAQDTLELLKLWTPRITGGVVHCFSYTKEMAREYLNMGFFLGIGGVLTFKNAKKLVEAVAYIPLESILLETDCPYLVPEPHRGHRNQSSYIDLVAEKLAEIKQISKEQVLEQTMENARKFYGIM